MTCRQAQDDYEVEGDYTWPADSLARTVLCPTKRPLAHGNPDEVPSGALEFVTAHRVRVEQPDNDEDTTHVSYGQLVYRPGTGYEVRMGSQPGLTHDSRVWNPGRFFRQRGPCPDDLLPPGAIGVMVDHLAPYPVEALYRSEVNLCRGELA